jgi:DNA polymerase III delta prime subunit
MRAAVQALNYDPVRQLRESLTGPTSQSLSPLSSPSSTGAVKDREVILQGTALRDILLRGFRESSSPSPVSDQHTVLQGNLFSPNAHLTSWARRYSRPDPVVIPGDPDLRVRGLNDTQIRAIAVMLGGMPGPVQGSLPEPPAAPEAPLLVEKKQRDELRDTAELPSRMTPRTEGERRMALVLGPPGTGKTKTIIEAVRMLKQHFSVPYPILLCTYTNVAVDNLVDGFVRHGSSGNDKTKAKPLKALRIGSIGKVRPSLEPYTLEAQLAIHPRAPDLAKVQERIAQTTKQRKELWERIKEIRSKLGDAHIVRNSQALRAKAFSAMESTHNSEIHGQGVPFSTPPGQGVVQKSPAKGLARRLEAMEIHEIQLEWQETAQRKRSYAMYMEMLNDIVNSADVVSALFCLWSFRYHSISVLLQICTTCITSASSSLNVIDFPIVFIDEASMSTEPASLIPLMKGVSLLLALATIFQRTETCCL